MQHLLQHEPRRPPLSDWKAQVERIASRRYGRPVTLITAVAASYYNCGVEPHEAAADLIGD